MKHPCVELYFQLNSGPLEVRVWLKTDNEIKDGSVALHHYLKLDEIKEWIARYNIVEMHRMVSYLSTLDCVSAFQVTYRHDVNHTGIVVYREWP